MSARDRERLEAQLVDLLYEELSPSDAQAAREALAAHPDLEAKLEDYEKVRAAAARVEEIEPDPQLRYAVLRAARQAADEKPEGFFAWLGQLGMAPALSGVAVVFLAVAGVLNLSDSFDESAAPPAAVTGAPPPAAVAEGKPDEKNAEPPAEKAAIAAVDETATRAPAGGLARGLAGGAEVNAPARPSAAAPPAVAGEMGGAPGDGDARNLGLKSGRADRSAYPAKKKPARRSTAKRRKAKRPLSKGDVADPFADLGANDNEDAWDQRKAAEAKPEPEPEPVVEQRAARAEAAPLDDADGAEAPVRQQQQYAPPPPPAADPTPAPAPAPKPRPAERERTADVMMDALEEEQAATGAAESGPARSAAPRGNSNRDIYGGGSRGAQPTVPPVLVQARAASRAGNHREAVRRYEQYLDGYRDHADFQVALFEAARSHEELGEMPRALQLYKLVVANGGRYANEARKRIERLKSVQAKKRSPKKKMAPAALEADEAAEQAAEPQQAAPARE